MRWLAALILLCATSSWAAGGVAMTGGGSLMQDPGRAYHISTSGNDSNTGTRQSPWLTIGMVATQVTAGVEPGDRFYLKAGDTWDMVAARGINLLNVNGAPDQHIVIGKYGSGADPIIQGGAWGSSHRIIGMPGASYVTIKDLNLIGNANTYAFIHGDAATYAGGIHHVNFVRMTLDNTAADQDGDGHGIYLFDTYASAYPLSNYDQVNPLHHIKVMHSTFTGMGGMPGDVNKDKIDCISINPPKGGFVHIHHNTFAECADNAVDIPGEANHTIEYNTVLGGGHGGVSGSQPSVKLHSQFSHLSDSLVRGNLILSGDSYGLVFWNTSGVEVYNNTLFYEPGGNEQVMLLGDNEAVGADYYGTFTGNTIANNILIGSLRLDGLTAALSPVNNTYSNNIYYNPTTPAQVILYSTSGEWFTTDYAFASWAAITTDDTNQNPDLVTEPATFTDWETYGDFSPAVGGDSIDGGVDVGMTEDIDGNTVPNAGTSIPDVGAYEYTP